MRKILSRGLRFLPVLMVAACASGSAEPSDTPPAGATDTGLAIIEVIHNSINNSSTLTILIEPIAGGVTASLGTIEPGQTKRFNYNAVAGNYRLRAQGASNSPTFRLSNREIATWDMQNNRVTPRNKS